MIIGFDSSPSSTTACMAKEWPETGVGCTMLLYTCGTPVHMDSLMDGVPSVLNKASAVLQAQLDSIGQSTGADDLMYAATTLATACKDLNREIIAICDYLGQGIYLGGVIMYYTHGRYALLPFGGGRAYIYSAGTLIPQAVSSEEILIRDAMGSADNWECNFWQGDCINGLHFIFTTKKLPDLEAAALLISENLNNVSHPNTVSMLLKRELDKDYTYPAAVMEIRI